MKNLIVALMVLSTLVSCGKENKVAAAAAATVVANPAATTAVTTTDQAGILLGQKIDNHTTQFGLAMVTYYMSIGQLVNQQGAAVTFKYTKSAATAPDCEKYWIFSVCTSTQSSSSDQPVSRTVVSNTVLNTSKITELKTIINNRHALYPIQVSGYVFYIITKDNKQYAIDTRMPLQANPVGVSDSTGTEYMFKYEI